MLGSNDIPDLLERICRRGNMISERAVSVKRDDFEVRIHVGIDPDSIEEWDSLFQGTLIRKSSIALTTRSQMDGFSFYTLSVWCRNQIVLLLPLFETSYNIFDFAADAVPMRALKKGLKGLRGARGTVGSVKILGCGFVEEDKGHVGVRPGASPEETEIAWRVGLEALEIFARSVSARFISFLNFTIDGLHGFPLKALDEYVPFEGQALGAVSTTMNSIGEYFETLSKATRRDVRRKLKTRDSIKVVEVKDPTPYLDTIYRLYRETIARSASVLGVHSREYFNEICKVDDRAFYKLYFHNDTLVAFNLLIDEREYLYDKYFCMDETIGRSLNLYFVSWVENVESCIRRRISSYIAGTAAEELKKRLGSTLDPSFILLKSTSRPVQRLVRSAAKYLTKDIASRCDDDGSINMERLLVAEPKVANV